jgi:virulence factor Mce-like protein
MTGLRSLRARVAAWLAVAVAGSVALTGCGSVYDVPLPGGPHVGGDAMKVHIIFRDVLDLVPQSTVKVDDVSVGKVTSVKLKGYTADVTVALPKDVDLPENAQATIRQTSLLGEKFVSLAEPAHPSSGKLKDGDTIGLDSTGRNPEVEEVFGALAALLSGGGVGQLKVIAEEMNKAVGGREEEVRSVLDQIHLFMGQLADNKDDVVNALDNVNRLAGQLRSQDKTIRLTLDNLPEALASVDKQRADLVRMLQSLDRLSGVGVQVIKAAKESTINSLRDLSPVLFQLAKAGENFPKSLQVYLTYPFVDAAVGSDPQVARNLHMGDYTNLSIEIDLDLLKLTLPGLPTNTTLGGLIRVCKASPLAPGCAALEPVVNGLCALPGLSTTPLCTDGAPAQQGAASNGTKKPTTPATPGTQADVQHALQNAIQGLIGGGSASSGSGGTQPPSATGGGSGASGGSGSSGSGGLGGLLHSLGLGRAGLGPAFQTAAAHDLFTFAGGGYDTGIGTLLFQGVLG